MNVMIIGSGIAGLMAAYQIAGMSGIQVTVLSTGAGASPFVHGINMPLYQKDSVRTFIEDTLESGYHLSDPKLVDCLCRDSLAISRDLMDLGIEFDKKDNQYTMLKPLGSTYPRIVSSGNHTGVKIINRLRNKLLESGSVLFSEDGRALKLFMKDGRPDGVLVYHEKSGILECMRTQCIILACGGFAGIFPFSTNTADIGGDGIAMAYEAGVPLIDLEFIQFEPSVALYPKEVAGKGVITTMFYEGAVLRNVHGERFMGTSEGRPGECVNKDILSRAIYEEIAKGNAAGHGGVYFDATGVGREKLMESYDSYVKRYLAAGVDITKEPFEIAPGPHTTLGGVQIHTDCSTEVPGIFAAGEIIGGLHGANRIGGNAGLEILVFGKRAGLGARRYLEVYKPDSCLSSCKWEPEQTAGRSLKEVHFQILNRCPLKRTRGRNMEIKDLNRIRERMQYLLDEYFNVIREGNSMEAAKNELKSLLDEVKWANVSETLYIKYRLLNDLTCAWLFANAACTRTKSVGCHIRTDSMEEDSRYHIVIRKKHGNLNIKKEQAGGT